MKTTQHRNQPPTTYQAQLAPLMTTQPKQITWPANLIISLPTRKRSTPEDPPNTKDPWDIFLESDPNTQPPPRPRHIFPSPPPPPKRLPPPTTTQQESWTKRAKRQALTKPLTETQTETTPLFQLTPLNFLPVKRNPTPTPQPTRPTYQDRRQPKATKLETTITL
jgi:hypothetical protein